MLNEIKNFIVLAECKNYTTASNILFLSQSTLSKQISKLETELGVSLFKRTTRSVELTPAGEALLTESRAYMNFCQTIQKEFPKNSNQDNRDVLLGLAESIPLDPIFPILSSFLSSHPEINTTYILEKDDNLFQLLMEEELDFIYTFKTLIEDYSQFDYVSLKKIKLYIVLWKGHPLAKKKKVKLSELEKETFIDNSAAPALLRKQLNYFYEKNGFYPKVISKIKSVPLCLLMVSSHQGVFLTTFQASASALGDNLVFKEIDTPYNDPLTMENSLVLVWKKKRCASNKNMRCFAEYVKSVDWDNQSENNPFPS